jgi:hypothetical protein
VKLAEERFSITTEEEGSSIALQCEENYLRVEPITDDISKPIVVNLQGGSETSSCSSSEEEDGEEGVAEEYDGEFSGI